MLLSLKDVQADDCVIGFYQGMTLGSFFNQTLVDSQAIHQEKLRHGGVVIVHGENLCAPQRVLRRAGLIPTVSSPKQTSRRLHEATRLSGRSD